MQGAAWSYPLRNIRCAYGMIFCLSTLPTSLLTCTTRAERAERALGRATRHPASSRVSSVGRNVGPPALSCRRSDGAAAKQTTRELPRAEGLLVDDGAEKPHLPSGGVCRPCYPVAAVLPRLRRRAAAKPAKPRGALPGSAHHAMACLSRCAGCHPAQKPGQSAAERRLQ